MNAYASDILDSLSIKCHTSRFHSPIHTLVNWVRGTGQAYDRGAGPPHRAGLGPRLLLECGQMCHYHDEVVESGRPSTTEPTFYFFNYFFELSSCLTHNGLRNGNGIIDILACSV